MRALVLSLVAFPLLIAAPVQAQQPTLMAFCFTDIGGATSYFSPVYESGLKAGGAVSPNGSTSAREFLAYVRARYNYTTGSNYPSTCSFGATKDAAELTRGGLMGRVRNESHAAVEVDWHPSIDSAAAAASFGAPPQNPNRPAPEPKAEHGYCVSEVQPGPQYVSAVFEPPQPVAIYQWVQGWMKLLGDKYQYKGAVYCHNENIEVAKRIIRAYTEGAKAAGRKVVDTEWKPGGAAPAAAPAAKPDNDDEPAKPGAPAAAAAGPRAAAQKDAAMARAYCRKDKLMARLFSCPKVEEAVVAYRTAHPQQAGEPMETVFSGDRVNCQTCLMPAQLTAWARRQTLDAGLPPKVATCTAAKFVAGMTAKPYYERVQEQYDAALKQCK